MGRWSSTEVEMSSFSSRLGSHDSIRPLQKFVGSDFWSIRWLEILCAALHRELLMMLSLPVVPRCFHTIVRALTVMFWIGFTIWNKLLRISCRALINSSLHAKLSSQDRFGSWHFWSFRRSSRYPDAWSPWKLIDFQYLKWAFKRSNPMRAKARIQRLYNPNEWEMLLEGRWGRKAVSYSATLSAEKHAQVGTTVVLPILSYGTNLSPPGWVHAMPSDQSIDDGQRPCSFEIAVATQERRILHHRASHMEASLLQRMQDRFGG